MAANENPKPAKRRLKAPAPSVRERADKAQADAGKPTKRRPVRAAYRTVAKPFRPVGRALRKLFRKQPFKFIGFVFVPPFVRSSFKELKLVTWPNARETRQLTLAVIIFAVIFAIIVTAVDFVLDKAFKALFIS